MLDARTSLFGVKSLVLSAMLLTACGGGMASRGEVPAVYTGPIMSTDAQSGQLVYEQHCNGCHPGGDEGFGPAVAGIGADPGTMRQQIREGSGRMPGFDASEISAEALEQLLAYLVAVRGVSPSTN